MQLRIILFHIKNYDNPNRFTVPNACGVDRVVGGFTRAVSCHSALRLAKLSVSAKCQAKHDCTRGKSDDSDFVLQKIPQLELRSCSAVSMM